jgi:hypothetical protein
MRNRYSDDEELRPTGEASHIPDERLTDRGNGEPRKQRVATNNTGYPDESAEIDSECESCGISIPAGQSKCRFCLTNHLNAAGDQGRSATGWSLLHVVQMLVKASTFYGAVAKGAAAASLLANSESEPAVNDCQLIYDLDEAPAPQLADQWPSFPGATRVTSERGAQLLAAARNRTSWTETTPSRHDGEHATFLYDETGSGIRTKDRLANLRERADDDVWLVPAIALQESVVETNREQPRRERPNRENLEGGEFGQETENGIRGIEAVGDDE